MVTKLRNEITNFRQRPDESLFEAWEHHKLSIDRCGTFMKRLIEECYDLIENMIAHHNDWDTSIQRSESSSSITSSFEPEIVALKAKMAEINKNLMKVLQINQQVKVVSHNCETCGGPHSYNDCPSTVGQIQNVYAAGAFNQGGNSYQPQGIKETIMEFLRGTTKEETNSSKELVMVKTCLQLISTGLSSLGLPSSSSSSPDSSTQVVTTTEFTNYMKANDAILKNMQTNMTSLTNSNLELKNIFGQFMKMNTASSSSSDTLPSNTVTNPKDNLKGITTRSGNAYKGPTIPTTFSPPKVVKRETEVTKDTPVVAPVVEPVVAPISAPKPNQKPSIPYPSRLHDQKLCDKSNEQKEKFFKIFKDLDFNISFADALILMPKFGPTIKSLLTNKEKLLELARTPLNEHCSAVFLKKLPEKLGIPTERALIDVYEGELTLRVGKEAVTFNLDQTSRYSANYDAMSVNRINLIDVACEEYSQEVLGFFLSDNPTPSMKPGVSNSSPTLSPFGDSDFLLEETDAFLAIDDEPISLEIDDCYYDSEGDILLLEEFLNDDPSSPPLPPQELKVVEPTNEKYSIDEPSAVELKDLPPHLKYAFLEGDDKLPVIIAKDLKDEEKTALIKIAWPMTRLFKKDTPFFFSKECIEAFQTLKKKLTEAPILVAPDWDLPFELMCDASDFSIGAVLGKRKTKHFQPIHYASKTMTDAQAHYTTTEKELLAVVYAFEKFWPYLVLSKSIVYTDHSALKSCLTSKIPSRDCSSGFSSFKEIDIAVRDKKGAENLAADHLSQLENPHQSVLDKKEIKHFPFRHLAWYLFVVIQIKSSDGVFMARKPLIFSRLATIDPPGDIMARTISLKRCLTLGINFMGSFPSSRGNKYILMAVDYLSKWVEAKALPTNDARVVCKFLKSLFARFGTPRAINIDRGGILQSWFKKNLGKTVGKNRASSSNKLDDALWAFHTAFKTPIGCTLYKLVYENACHLPIEIEHKAYWALKHYNYDLLTAGDHRKVQLNELNELRDQAYENSLIYKKKTKRIHDSKIKDCVFNVGNRVVLFNSRLKIFSGKFKTHWFGPFTITQVFPYGTVELSQTDWPNFKVNGHRLKHYFGEDIPKMVVLDL
nr:reverse transcriptase domain-containing protein [Tanacetum cinerariifolium]GEY82652.1 reverse transcriptase domain-containing protein [Tanacetum cinerariifolium]